MKRQELARLLGSNEELPAEIGFDAAAQPIVRVQAPDGSMHEIAAKASCCGKCRTHSPHCRVPRQVGERMGVVLICPLLLRQLAQETSTAAQIR